MVYWKVLNTINIRCRRWLNPKSFVENGSTGGAIAWRIHSAKDSSWISSFLSIQDCHKTINLDVDLDCPKDRDITLKKIRILVKELERFYDAASALDYEKEKPEPKKKRSRILNAE